MTLINMPIQMVLSSMYIGVVYTMTNQPLEFDRIIMFFSVCVMIALISESIGLAISSTLNIIVSNVTVAVWEYSRNIIVLFAVESYSRLPA